MINLDLIKQFADLQKQVMSNGVYGFYTDGSIQVSAKDLLDVPNVQVKSYDSKEYPFQAFVIINGIKLFGLLSKEETVKYFDGYMVEDVKFWEDGVESAS
jgi:hypothetical protein